MLRYFAATAALVLTVVLGACSQGGTISDNRADLQPDGSYAPPNRYVVAGAVRNPAPSTDSDWDWDAAVSDKAASWSYHYFFLDSVNHQSWGRWTSNNFAGKKEFMLSNTCHSQPKSLILGCNYWNREEDDLITNTFTVPGITEGIKLAFYTRFSIQPGDFGYIQYRIDGGEWVTLAYFTESANESYPEWDKFTFALPDNEDEGGRDYQVRFYFTSDTAQNDWGWGVDSISVYQRIPEPPVNVQASDGTYTDKVEVTWEHPTDYAPADVYELYRADSEFGTYTYKGAVVYPATSRDDNSAVPGTTYWYKVIAVRDGYAKSKDSSIDDGFASNN